MNRGRKVNKLKLIRKHRQDQYLHAINKVIDGEAPPDYATKRFNKLKQVEGKK